jgi:hypothetical protein
VSEHTRAIVLRESLTDGHLPARLPGRVVRRYPHLLSGVLPVEVIEITLAQEDVPVVAFALAGCLVPEGFYAHLVSEDLMIVVFPRCITQIPRHDADAVVRAQRIGQTFGIPLNQMRFAEMFTTDHPDSPQPVEALAGHGTTEQPAPGGTA